MLYQQGEGAPIAAPMPAAAFTAPARSRNCAGHCTQEPSTSRPSLAGPNNLHTTSSDLRQGLPEPVTVAFPDFRCEVFHRTPCGCEDLPWQGNLVDSIWMHPPQRQSVPKLRVCYFLPHWNVTGGMKMLIEHIRRLKKRGHWVQVAFRHRKGVSMGSGELSRALPPWARDIRVDSEVVLQPHHRIPHLFSLGASVVVIGYFTQLLELKNIASCPGPVVYWEQGSEHLFGDPAADRAWDRVFHWSMRLPIALMSVSNVVQATLRSQFGRVAPVIPNGIDCMQFVPSLPLDTSRLGNTVLLVGNPALPLKNFGIALQALNIVHRHIKSLQVVWICQVKPACTGVTFPVRFIVNPAQSELPKLFRGHDCMLFTSLYEAWGMPVLEAMAAGVPVVTSRCYGVNMFCEHGVNCLMDSPYNAEGLAAHVVRLLSDRSFAARMAANGRLTAVRCTWRQAIDHLEARLLTVSTFLSPSISKGRADRDHSAALTRLGLPIPPPLPADLRGIHPTPASGAGAGRGNISTASDSVAAKATATVAGERSGDVPRIG